MTQLENFAVLSVTFGNVFDELLNKLPDGSLLGIWQQSGSKEPELVYALENEFSFPLEVRGVDGVRKGLHLHQNDIAQAIDGVLPFTYGNIVNCVYKRAD